MTGERTFTAAEAEEAHIINAMIRAAQGQPVSDFEASFPSVRAVLDAVARLTADNVAIRTLMDIYNMGGWTDTIAPMKRALAAEAAITAAAEREQELETDRDHWRTACEMAEGQLRESAEREAAKDAEIAVMTEELRLDREYRTWVDASLHESQATVARLTAERVATVKRLGQLLSDECKRSKELEAALAAERQKVQALREDLASEKDGKYNADVMGLYEKGFQSGLRWALLAIERHGLTSDAPQPANRKCTCWIGRGEPGGMSAERQKCAVHGDAPQPAGEIT